jgi:hypothetical protein
MSIALFQLMVYLETEMEFIILRNLNSYQRKEGRWAAQAVERKAAEVPTNP